MAAEEEFAEVGRAPPRERRDRETLDGWEAYRNWLTGSVPVRRERSRPDHSISTWKGYKSWSEKIRRTWADES